MLLMFLKAFKLSESVSSIGIQRVLTDVNLSINGR